MTLAGNPFHCFISVFILPRSIILRRPKEWHEKEYAEKCAGSIAEGVGDLKRPINARDGLLPDFHEEAEERRPRPHPQAASPWTRSIPPRRERRRRQKGVCHRMDDRVVAVEDLRDICVHVGSRPPRHEDDATHRDGERPPAQPEGDALDKGNERAEQLFNV